MKNDSDYNYFDALEMLYEEVYRSYLAKRKPKKSICKAIDRIRISKGLEPIFKHIYQNNTDS